MDDKRPKRRDVLAFWLGTSALLLALCPLAMMACVTSPHQWFFPEWVLSASMPIAMIVASIAAIGVGALSLLVRPNWRGGAGIAIGTLCLLAFLALGALIANAPDR